VDDSGGDHGETTVGAAGSDWVGGLLMFRPAQRAIQMIAATVFIAAGFAHFLFPDILARFIPPYLPAATALVLLSGAFEVMGGVGMLLSRFRGIAAWGLSAMLISFLPANLFMAMRPVEAGLAGVPSAVFWARIALLPVMVWGLLWCARPGKLTAAADSRKAR
jgi:uncharacterized membrane protein